MFKFFRRSLCHSARCLLVLAAPTSLLLLFSFYLTLALSFFPSFLLPQTLWQIRQELSCLSSCIIRRQWDPGHSFFPGNDAADKRARWEALLESIPQSLVVFFLLSLVSILLFSWTGGVLSHLNSLIHRFPWFPPRNLCSMVMLAVPSLVYAATDTANC